MTNTMWEIECDEWNARKAVGKYLNAFLVTYLENKFNEQRIKQNVLRISSKQFRISGNFSVLSIFQKKVYNKIG